MPVAEILVLGGFLFIYSLEELTHLVLVCTGNLSSGHGHSHDEIEVPVEETIQATSRGFLIVLALCIHDFFEGIALGVSRTQTETYFLLAAFAAHKWVIAGTVGLNWARSHLRPIIAFLYMSVFCGISPIGIGAGIALKEEYVGHVMSCYGSSYLYSHFSGRWRSRPSCLPGFGYR